MDSRIHMGHPRKGPLECCYLENETHMLRQILLSLIQVSLGLSLEGSHVPNQMEEL